MNTTVKINLVEPLIEKCGGIKKVFFTLNRIIDRAFYAVDFGEERIHKARMRALMDALAASEFTLSFIRENFTRLHALIYSVKYTIGKLERLPHSKPYIAFLSKIVIFGYLVLNQVMDCREVPGLQVNYSFSAS